MVISLGGINAGPVREDRFVIVPGSEIMAILALANDLTDLEARISRIIVGLTRDRKPVTAGDLKAAGAMTLLLKDAILPNLVQTLEGGPALVHCGPFGNIAHGCNSVAATKLGAVARRDRADRGGLRRGPRARRSSSTSSAGSAGSSPKRRWWSPRCGRSRCTAA